MALLMQAIPLIVGAQLLLGLIFISWQLTLLSIVSLFMASVLFFLITYIIGLSAFWLQRVS